MILLYINSRYKRLNVERKRYIVAGKKKQKQRRGLNGGKSVRIPFSNDIDKNNAEYSMDTVSQLLDEKISLDTLRLRLKDDSIKNSRKRQKAAPLTQDTDDSLNAVRHYRPNETIYVNQLLALDNQWTHNANTRHKSKHISTMNDKLKSSNATKILQTQDEIKGDELILSTSAGPIKLSNKHAKKLMRGDKRLKIQNQYVCGTNLLHCTDESHLSLPSSNINSFSTNLAHTYYNTNQPNTRQSIDLHDIPINPSDITNHVMKTSSNELIDKFVNKSADMLISNIINMEQKIANTMDSLNYTFTRNNSISIAELPSRSLYDDCFNNHLNCNNILNDVSSDMNMQKFNMPDSNQLERNFSNIMRDKNIMRTADTSKADINNMYESDINTLYTNTTNKNIFDNTECNENKYIAIPIRDRSSDKKYSRDKLHTDIYYHPTDSSTKLNLKKQYPYGEIAMPMPGKTVVEGNYDSNIIWDKAICKKFTSEPDDQYMYDMLTPRTSNEYIGYAISDIPERDAFGADATPLFAEQSFTSDDMHNISEKISFDTSKICNTDIYNEKLSSADCNNEVLTTNNIQQVDNTRIDNMCINNMCSSNERNISNNKLIFTSDNNALDLSKNTSTCGFTIDSVNTVPTNMTCMNNTDNISDPITIDSIKPYIESSTTNCIFTQNESVSNSKEGLYNYSINWLNSSSPDSIVKLYDIDKINADNNHFDFKQHKFTIKDDQYVDLPSLDTMNIATCNTSTNSLSTQNMFMPAVRTDQTTNMDNIHYYPIDNLAVPKKYYQMNQNIPRTADEWEAKNNLGDMRFHEELPAANVVVDNDALTIEDEEIILNPMYKLEGTKSMDNDEFVIVKNKASAKSNVSADFFDQKRIHQEAIQKYGQAPNAQNITDELLIPPQQDDTISNIHAHAGMTASIALSVKLRDMKELVTELAKNVNKIDHCIYDQMNDTLFRMIKNTAKIKRRSHHKTTLYELDVDCEFFRDLIKMAVKLQYLSPKKGLYGRLAAGIEEIGRILGGFLRNINKFEQNK